MSQANAAKKYKKALQNCPDAAVRRSAKAKHNAHQAASRARKKEKKVRASDSDRGDSGCKIESEERVAQSAHAAPSTVSPAQATPVARRSSTRSYGAFGASDTRGQCVICGAHGDIQWVVNVASGIRRSAWKRFEPQDGPEGTT